MKSIPLGMTIVYQLYFAFSVLLPSPYVAATTDHSSSAQHYSQNIGDWLNSREGGFLNPKVEIRRADPHDETSMTGVYAKERIEMDEILFHVPWHSLIHSARNGKEYTGETYLSCTTTENFIDEINKGNDSEFAPYVNHMKRQATGHLPSAWSQEGKQLLVDILGGDSNSQSLPPFKPFSHFDEWVDSCGGSMEYLDAAMFVASRADEELLVPIYELMNHRSFTANSSSDFEMMITAKRQHGEYHQTRARRTIQAGEQIYNDYNYCEGCVIDRTYCGTADIFKDFGFVESMPQAWYFFSDTYLAFAQTKDENGGVEWGWDMEVTSQHEIFIEKFFVHELRRLKRLRARITDVGTTSLQDQQMPENEWSAIWQYYDALVAAMTAGLESFESSNSDICTWNETNLCSHYFNIQTGNDDLSYLSTHASFTNGYLSYFSVESPSDEIVLDTETTLEFQENEYADEICLLQDDDPILCPSFSTHVYETLVHFPAQFLDEVRRVLIVGGGNAMALNEVLKYPNIDRIVVLEEHYELAVKSFEYFDTDPHFDNDKVSWWFGPMDLSMLLEEDPFDLILVETRHCWDDATIEALSCVLHETGVLAGYGNSSIQPASRIFDFATQISIEDSVLDKYRWMVFASHGVDFSQETLRNHGVKTLDFDYLNNSTDVWRKIQDYRKNLNPPLSAKCHAIGMERKGDIINIVEMQEVQMSSHEVRSTLRDTILQHGYFTISEHLNADGLLILVISNGYLKVRVFPETNRVRLDLHMQNTTEEESLRIHQAAAHSLGAMKSSSVRIVPQSSRELNTGVIVEAHSEQRMESKEGKRKASQDLQLRLTLSLFSHPSLPLEEASVGVVCGKENTPCPSYDILTNELGNSKVTPFWSCNGLLDRGIETTHNTTKDMIDCEKNLMRQLDRRSSMTSQLDFLVLDQSASTSMLQIFDSMLSSFTNRKRWLSSGWIIFALSFDNETWSSRRAFLDRMRLYTSEDPVAQAEYVVHSEDIEDIEFHVLGSRPEESVDMFSKLPLTLADVAATANVTSFRSVELTRFARGKVKFNEMPKQDELEDDYDDEEEEYETSEIEEDESFEIFDMMTNQAFVQFHPAELSYPSFDDLMFAIENTYASVNMAMVTRNISSQSQNRSLAILSSLDVVTVLSYDSAQNIVLDIDVHGENHVEVSNQIIGLFASQFKKPS